MIQRGEIRHWHKQADKCAELRKADQAAWDAAAAQYRVNVAAREAEQIKAKETADDKLDDALARARAAAARYIGVRTETNRGGTGAAASKSATAGEPYSPSEMPIVDGIRVSAGDVTLCSENTARLLNAHEWVAQLEAR